MHITVRLNYLSENVRKLSVGTIDGALKETLWTSILLQESEGLRLPLSMGENLLSIDIEPKPREGVTR
jgi:hypothetical protein